MRTAEEIKNMFKDMGLETEEKRAKYPFTFPGQSSVIYDRLVCYHPDTKIQKINGGKNAELE